MAEQEQWLKAWDHLGEVEGRYKELVGRPGVNPWFALGNMSQLRERYESGERTDALLEALQNLE